MSWEIVLGIIALVGFIITVSSPMLKLNTSITKLNETINSLRDTVAKNDQDNKQSHQRIYDRLDKHESFLYGHNERLSNIENAANRRLERLEKLEKETVSQEGKITHIEAHVQAMEKDVSRNEQRINSST